MGEIRLLDCTLRDGGYVNDWKFGHNELVTVFDRLVSSGVDIIEIGFLDERREYDVNRTILPDGISVEKTFGGLNKGSAMIVGMIDFGTCSVNRLLIASESFLDGIRVIFKKNIMKEALAFCTQIKELGYQVFAQAVSITSYNDEEFDELLCEVNRLEPYAFSLVDTYGLLHKNQLIHYFDRANEKLKPQIGLGYHSHNNFQLGYANCIELIDKKIERMLLIDGSLYGMGKGAGNTPIELLAMYMNENCDKKYHGNQFLEAIDVTIMDIYRKTPWGYNLKFFIAASNDCHPNYVAALMEKKKLSVKSINEILETIPKEKKLLFDENLIQRLYEDYQKIEINDDQDRLRLKEQLRNQNILLLGPGKTVRSEKNAIEVYIKEKNPILISINFIPDEIIVSYVFMSNAKRYVNLATKLDKEMLTIATSNVTRAKGNFDFVLEYGRLLDEQALIRDNPLFIMLKFLKECDIRSIGLAGFDGYSKCVDTNYVNQNMEYIFSKEKAELLNKDTAEGIVRANLNCSIEFVTKSFYPELMK